MHSPLSRQGRTSASTSWEIARQDASPVHVHAPVAPRHPWERLRRYFDMQNATCPKVKIYLKQKNDSTLTTNCVVLNDSVMRWGAL